LPYFSRGERRRTDYWTLPEVVAYVERVDCCQPEEARRQISHALADGNLWHLRWVDERRWLSGPTGRASIPFDEPPRRWSDAEIAEIDWVDGTAVDHSEFAPGRRRCLLIHRLSIARWWPERKEKPPKPTDEQVYEWMGQNVKRPMKRNDVIADCRKATGATARQAAAAHKRLPEKFKFKRGQRARPGKIEQ
jgi:hypothetical protein